MERPQAPEGPAVRRGLFATAALPLPMATSATPVSVATTAAPSEAPTNQHQEAQTSLAGSPALQTLLQLQPSLDPSTRAGVVNVLRQWGVQPPQGSFALLPVQAPVQQAVQDDLELFRQTLKNVLLLVERIAGVHINPLDPNEAVPVSVLARKAGQNELYPLVPLVRGVGGLGVWQPTQHIRAAATDAAGAGGARGGGRDRCPAAPCLADKREGAAGGASPAAGSAAASADGVAAAGAAGGAATAGGAAAAADGVAVAGPGCPDPCHFWPVFTDWAVARTKRVNELFCCCVVNVINMADPTMEYTRGSDVDEGRGKTAMVRPLLGENVQNTSMHHRLHCTMSACGNKRR